MAGLVSRRSDLRRNCAGSRTVAASAGLTAAEVTRWRRKILHRNRRATMEREQKQLETGAGRPAATARALTDAATSCSDSATTSPAARTRRHREPVLRNPVPNGNRARDGNSSGLRSRRLRASAR